MKKLIIPAIGLIVLIFSGCKDKNVKTASPQITDCIVSQEGIDSLKLDMPKAALEKLLGIKITLKHITVDDHFFDTVQAKYKNMDVRLLLQEGDSLEVAKLSSIMTSSPLCKTSSGIRVGDEKIKIIDSYTANRIYADYEYETYPQRSKTRSTVAVTFPSSEYERRIAIIFYLEKNKMTAVEISNTYEFD
ncbi:MAG: hypothetical protein ABIR30_07510 [Chitinophagaceae bacterium]